MAHVLYCSLRDSGTRFVLLPRTRWYTFRTAPSETVVRVSYCSLGDSGTCFVLLPQRQWYTFRTAPLETVVHATHCSIGNSGTCFLLLPRRHWRMFHVTRILKSQIVLRWPVNFCKGPLLQGSSTAIFPEIIMYIKGFNGSGTHGQHQSFLLADVSVQSTRKSFICIMYNDVYWIKVS